MNCSEHKRDTNVHHRGCFLNGFFEVQNSLVKPTGVKRTIQGSSVHVQSCKISTTVQFRMRPSPPKYTLWPFVVPPCSYPEAQATTHLCSVAIGLFPWMFPVSGILRDVVFGVCLCPRGQRTLRSVPAVAGHLTSPLSRAQAHSATGAPPVCPFTCGAWTFGLFLWRLKC